MKKQRLILFLGVLVILGALLACGGSDTNTGTAAGNTQTKDTPVPAPKHFKVGQKVKIGDVFEQVVNSVKISNGDDMNQPKSGMHYLLVDVSLTNVSQKEQNISSLAMWDLRDSSGQQYTEAITSFSKPPDGKLEAGAPLRGVIAYEVPTLEKKFTLSFQADMLASGQTVWDITV